MFVLLSPPRGELFSRDRVDFSGGIRPIFKQNCVSCHGGVRQKNGVLLHLPTGKRRLVEEKLDAPPIVPRDRDASELIRRITSKDPDQRMPYHVPPLSSPQMSLIRRWSGKGRSGRIFRDTGLAGVYWELRKMNRKFITSHSVTGTILYYPRPLLRRNPCKRQGF
jgi:hypothetical protein